MMQVTLRDVADAAGVSVSTVSKVVSGQAASARLKPATIERVQAVAARLGYVPNQVARDLRARRAGQIGLVLNSLATPETAVMLTLDGALLMGLSLAAREMHVPAVVIYPQAEEEEVPADLLQYREGRIDGLLVRAIPLVDDPLLPLLEASRLPIVALWRQEVPPHLGFSDIDHRGGAMQGTQHLLTLGHRRIAFLGPSPLEPNARNLHLIQRRQGYEGALLDAGVVPQPEWRVHGVADVLHQLRRSEPITAVVAATDLRAATLAAELAQAGVRIPDDLSLVGFDDLVTANLIAGGLTTVSHPIQEMASRAVRSLIALMDGAPACECRTIVSTHLVIRHSTAPVEGE